MSQVEDVLGIKPIANSVEKVVDGTISFIARICNPCADEFGLLLQDKVRAWRANNARKIEQKAEKLALKHGSIEGKTVHPHIAYKIIDNGSFSDTEELQNMWAGLLVSSMKEIPDDSNRIFVDLISQLTVLQAKIINYACQTSHKYQSSSGFIYADTLELDNDEFHQIIRCDDLHRLDRELDKLRAMGLFMDGVIGGGRYHPESNTVSLTPSSLALQLFVACSGSNTDPITFFNAKQKTAKQLKQEELAIEREAKEIWDSL